MATTGTTNATVMGGSETLDNLLQLDATVTGGSVMTEQELDEALTDGLEKLFEQWNYNFNVMGLPNINNETMVVDGFSNQNYLQIRTKPESISSLEIVFKFKITNNNFNHHMVLLGQSFANFVTPQVELNSRTGKMAFLVTESGVSPWISVASTDAPTLNTWTWMKCIWDGTNIELFTSTDGVDYTSQGSAACSNIYWDEKCNIGHDQSIDITSAFEVGSIDLSESYIKINGSDFWVPEITQDNS